MNLMGKMKEMSDISETKGGGWQFSREALDKYDKLLGDDKLDTSDRQHMNGAELTEDKGADCLDTIPEKMKKEKSFLLPRNGGEWSGELGNSKWKPDSNIEPGDRNGTNPEHKTWKEIKKQYSFESIPFNDGEPSFSEVAKGEVQIDDFSDDRGSNFDQADEKLAEQRGCTPEEVEKWRADNKYTWHELRDCKTMQKVPTEVHGNISHSGGISEYKLKNQND